MLGQPSLGRGSIRLKIERNGIQDIDLINTAKKNKAWLSKTKERLRKRLPIRTWESPPRVARELPPEDWDSRNLRAEHEPFAQMTKGLDPLWWRDLRNIALGKEVI